MFTRSLFNTADISRQPAILAHVASMAGTGQLHTTLNETLYGFDVATFQIAHRKIESGKTIGKIAIAF